MYDLMVNGIKVKSAEKIKYLKIEFYVALQERKKVWIERNGTKVAFNGRKIK